MRMQDRCSRTSSPATPARRTEKIATDTDRDFVMTAAEAKEYGIIDEVISDFVEPHQRVDRFRSDHGGRRVRQMGHESAKGTRRSWPSSGTAESC
jgi:hypothetical protein